MSPTIYIKENTLLRLQLTKRRERFFFLTMTILGLATIFSSIWPTLAWQVKTLPRLTGSIDQIPIPQAQVLSAKTLLANDVQVVENPDGFSYFTTNYRPPAHSSQRLSESTTGGPRPQKFQVTIPRLKIEKATARVDNLDFYQSLSHFPGSALPGEIGNSFITGHSVLPQFANSQNYRAIFTNLSDLEIGDDVFIQTEGQTLHFVVQYAKVVNPHDLSVLLPISASGRNLTLMTCVPPGTNLKRLVVITSLI